MALRQLAVVVARRHGAEIESVFPKLMNLISGGEQLQKQVSASERMNWSFEKIMVQSDKLELDSAVYSHERRLKRFRLQPRLISAILVIAISRLLLETTQTYPRGIKAHPSTIRLL